MDSFSRMKTEFTHEIEENRYSGVNLVVLPAVSAINVVIAVACFYPVHNTVFSLFSRHYMGILVFFSPDFAKLRLNTLIRAFESLCIYLSFLAGYVARILILPGYWLLH